MKKRRKGRLLALMLALVMAFTMVPSVNAKADGNSYNISFGDTWDVMGDQNEAHYVYAYKDSAHHTPFGNGEHVCTAETIIYFQNFDPSSMEVAIYHNPDDNWEMVSDQVDQNGAFRLPDDFFNQATDKAYALTVQLKNNQGGNDPAQDPLYNVDFGANSWVINDGQADKTIYAFIGDGETNTIVANTAMEVTSNTTIKLFGGFDPSTMHVQVTDTADTTSENPFTTTLATNVGPDNAPYYETKIANHTNNGGVPTNLIFEVVPGAEQQGSNPGGDANYNVNFGDNSWVINDGQADKTIYAFIGDGETNTIPVNTAMEVTSNMTIKLYGGFDPSKMHVEVTEAGDVSNPFKTELRTNVGPNNADYYEVKIVNPNGGGIPENLTFAVVSGAENAGDNPNPPGGSEAIIKISAPKAEHVGNGYTDSVTVDSPLWHGNVTTRYSRQWANLSVSLNSGEAGGERTDTFHGTEEELEAENCDLSALERQKIRYVPDENDPTKVDISFHLNWGYDIVGLWVNGEDRLGVFEVSQDPYKTVFHDRNSFLRHYGDQGVTVTLPDVTVPDPSEKYNKSDENELPVFEIEVMVQPNTEVFIGNFLWSNEDCFAPYEQGGTEPSDLYIGHSQIKLMDIYFDDGSGDDVDRDPIPEYIQGVDDSAAAHPYAYKHLHVGENDKEFTDPDIHAIHYQLDREGTATGAVRKTSEMVMPTGTWVVMKIQPEQGYQVKSFHGVNRNKGNVVLLDDEGTDGACIFAFKIDEGNFHIGAVIEPYDDKVDPVEGAVKSGAVYLPNGDIDGGTGKLVVDEAESVNETAIKTFADTDAGIDTPDNGYTVEKSLDLDLMQTYLKGGVQAEGKSESWDIGVGHAQPLTEPAEISLTLDETTRGNIEGEAIQLVHEKAAGVYEIVPITSYDPETGAISFETTSFSNYSIVSKEVESPSGDSITVHSDTAVLNGNKAVFTYKDSVGDVIGTVEAPATALGTTDTGYTIDRSGAVTFTVKPAEGYSAKAGAASNSLGTVTGTYTSGANDTAAFFVFESDKQYNMTVVKPKVTVGEGEGAHMAQTSPDSSFTAAFEPNDGFEPSAGTPIFISNFDPESMAVVIKKYSGDDPSTASFLTNLTPVRIGETDVYRVKLGVLDVSEGEKLTFELVEKSTSNGEQPGPGPNRPEGTEIRFDGAKDIKGDVGGNEFTVVYDGPEGEVRIGVTGAQGDTLTKFFGDGPGQPAMSIFTTGDHLDLAFEAEPVRAEWWDDDGQTQDPQRTQIALDDHLKATVAVPTTVDALRRVEIDFFQPPRMFNVIFDDGSRTGVTAKYDNEGTPATLANEPVTIDEGRDIYLYGFDPLTMDVVLVERDTLTPRVEAKMNVFRPEDAGEDDPYIARVCDLKDDATIPDDVEDLKILVTNRDVRVYVRPGEGVADLRIDPQDNQRLLFETAGITQSFEAVLGSDRGPWSAETKHDEEGNEWTEYYITVAASQLNSVDYLTSVSTGDGFLRYFEGGDDSRVVELVDTNTQGIQTAKEGLLLNDFTDEYAIEICVPMATLVFIPDDYMAKNTNLSQDEKKVVCSNGQLEAEFSFSILNNGSDVLIPLEKRTIPKDQYNEWEHDEYYVDVLASKVDDINVVANLISNAGFFVDCEGQLISWGPQGYEPIASHYDAEHRFAAFNIHAILPPITETVTNDSIKVPAEEGCTFECTNLDIQGSTPITSDNGSFTGLNPATCYSIVKAMKDGNGFIGYSSAVTVTTLEANDDSVVETKDATITDEGAVVKTETKIDPDAPVGSVTGLDKNLVGALETTGVITQEEGAAVATGDDLTLTLTAENLDGEVPVEDRSAANAALAQITRDTGKKAVLGATMDISLLLKVGNRQERKLEQIPSPIRFSVTVPDGMLNTNPKIERTFYLLRFHENQATVLASGKRPVLTGSSNLFSTYGIAYVDEEVKTPAPPVTPDVKVSYSSHIQNIGWGQGYVANGTVSGTSGKSYRLEGIKIKVEGNKNLGVQYTTHVQDYGWMGWSSNDEMSGTEGEAKRLEAIKIQLTGADKDKYDVYYRVHAQNIGWMNWAKNGAAAGTAGYAYRLEAIQIVVVKKGASFDKNIGKISSVSADAYRDKNHGGEPNVSDAAVPNVTYRTHVQNVGWQAWKTNGAFAGTSGRSLRLEGIQMRLSNSDYAGGIRYKTHVQNDGWQDWRANGVMSGTSGRSLRLEAINVELTGEVAKHYDIYYRVHAQNYGWLGWAKNGESAGTSGQSLRLEGIQVVIVPKGSAAPGNTYKGVTADASKKAFYGK